MSCSIAKTDFRLKILCQFVPWSMAYITDQHLQDKVRPVLCHTQPELLQCGVILLQDNATPYHHYDVQKIKNKDSVRIGNNSISSTS
jgi:hypothetical protein